MTLSLLDNQEIVCGVYGEVELSSEELRRWY